MWHLTFATWDRVVLFPDARDRRAFLRALVAAIPELVLFALVDDHLHLVIDGDAARVAGIVLKMLRARCAARVDAPRRAPVAGRSHLESLVGYLANQAAKHGLAGAGPLWEGACHVDLLGGRRIEGFDPARLARHLPRVTPAWLRSRVRIGELGPPDLSVGPARVWEAALAAHLAEPEGRAPATVAARAVVVRLFPGLSSAALSQLVPISAVAIRSLRSRYDLDPRSVEVTLRRLVLEAAARSG